MPRQAPVHYKHILYNVDERIATITLNRPDVLNAYTPDMGDEIVAAFRAAEKDKNVRARIAFIYNNHCQKVRALSAKKN
jgi:enoyl-CoA hydratase/carnithine racemase